MAVIVLKHLLACELRQWIGMVPNKYRNYGISFIQSLDNYHTRMQTTIAVEDLLTEYEIFALSFLFFAAADHAVCCVMP